MRIFFDQIHDAQINLMPEQSVSKIKQASLNFIL
jgi:hypothetical protein